MCTSTSTTSGARSRIMSMAASTSDALPTTSTSSPSSARTPDRNSWWSSTRKTRITATPRPCGYDPPALDHPRPDHQPTGPPGSAPGHPCGYDPPALDHPRPDHQPTGPPGSAPAHPCGCDPPALDHPG